MIDLLDPSAFARGHPLDAYARLRREAPVYRHPEPGGPGFWVLTRYADVVAVDRDFETFSSQPTIMIADPPPGEAGMFGDAQMMLMMDPPRHTAFRKLIRAHFSRDASILRKPRLQALARQIVGRVADRGACEFVGDVAGEMPSLVIAELLGLPPDDGRALYHLTEAIHATPTADAPDAARQALMAMFAYAADLAPRRRARPGDDLCSVLLHAQVEGRPLTDAEFLLYFLLLVDAGGDTTRNALAGAIVALAAHPAQRDWLMADPIQRLACAREELLRFTSPVVYMRRTATRETTIGGTRICAGDKVVLYFGAANRDPDVFEHPDRLDLARDPNPHVAFGGGPHVCLGQHLARLEIDTLLYEVLTRMGSIEPVEPPVWLASTFISGPKRLDVRFGAEAAA